MQLCDRSDRPRTTAAALVAVLALSLSACGSDSAEASEAIAGSILNSNGAVLEFSRAQADCIGDGLVDQFGTDELITYGVLTDDLKVQSDVKAVDLSSKDATAFDASVNDCVGAGSAFASGRDDSPEAVAACLEAAPRILLLAGDFCGAEPVASKSIADSIMDSNGGSFVVTQEQADCVGDGFVEEIGTDRLVEYGIITEDLTTDSTIDTVEMSTSDAQSAADVMQDCADVKEIFAGAMGELPAEAQDCIDEKLTDDVLNKFLVAVFSNDQEAGTQELTAALTECITPQG